MNMVFVFLRITNGLGRLLNLKIEDMEIVVLGTGCAKCKTVEKIVRAVVETNGIDATVRKEEDIVKMMAYNIMTLPALVVDGVVVVKGRVPKEKEVLELLTK